MRQLQGGRVAGPFVMNGRECVLVASWEMTVRGRRGRGLARVWRWVAGRVAGGRRVTVVFAPDWGCDNSESIE